mmetsp:Transcript_6345/g.9640  ORF Transcript_6345/g.9640 Transcript_6345/m.9640 type:complete len:101 (-) Transcript_6345:571-873(-)
MRLLSSLTTATGLLTLSLAALTPTQAAKPFTPGTTAAFAAATTTTTNNNNNNNPPIKAGDKLPASDVFWGFPNPQKVNMASYCGGRNVIIVGLPGAFTPT